MNTPAKRPFDVTSYTAAEAYVLVELSGTDDMTMAVSDLQQDRGLDSLCGRGLVHNDEEEASLTYSGVVAAMKLREALFQKREKELQDKLKPANMREFITQSAVEKMSARQIDTMFGKLYDENNAFRKLLTKAYWAMHYAHNSLLTQCWSNPVHNALGKQVDMTRINELPGASSPIKELLQINGDDRCDHELLTTATMPSTCVKCGFVDAPFPAEPPQPDTIFLYAQRYAFLREQEGEQGIAVVDISNWHKPAMAICLTFNSAEALDTAVDTARQAKEEDV